MIGVLIYVPRPKHTKAQEMSSTKEPLLRALTNLTEQDARQVQWQAELKNEDWTV